MNDFARRLPWRLAALAGLLIGGISLAGGTDPWQCLLRAAVAFAVFAGLGLGLRALLEASGPAEKPPAPPAPAPKAGTGAHVDHTTPTMTAGDLPPAEDE